MVKVRLHDGTEIKHPTATTWHTEGGELWLYADNEEEVALYSAGCWIGATFEAARRTLRKVKR